MTRLVEEATFDSVQRLPLAHTIALHARQNLIKRLDDYQNYNRELFQKVCYNLSSLKPVGFSLRNFRYCAQVIHVLETGFLADIKQHAISGACLVRSENVLFEQDEAVRMALGEFLLS